ncbi:MAG: twin-arginine translocation signal domain-containing protein [Pirellulaceae bacterium]
MSSERQPLTGISRRQFLSATAAGTALALAAPAVLTASKTDTQLVVGQGDYRYEVLHNWPQLPAQFHWQTTHNVAVDRAGLLYVIHEGDPNQPDHPAIFVFDGEGKFVRSFGNQFQGGGHGIEVHEENGQEFLYVCAYQQVKAIAKLALDGTVVWHQHAPTKSGIYAADEATNPQKAWGRDRFMPTNTTFLPDGDFLVADGYGSYFVHRYDQEGTWKSCFGGPGEGQGKFDTPHGLGFDQRPGREPALVVADRAHHTLQYVTLDGRYLDTLTGFGLPANIDTHGDLMVVPELFARVSILNGNNEVVARLGDDSQRIRNDSQFAIRGDEKQWKPGLFVHPHDACFDADGNIFVAEWVATGRVTKLKRLG